MKKILIIGGGVAGLSAGIYARLSGYEAVICERHAIPGGNLACWKRQGFHIDNCIHWLTGTNEHTSLYKMWKDLGVLGDIEIYKRDSLLIYEDETGSIALLRDFSAFEKQLLDLSPEDEKEIRSFMKAIDTIQGYIGIAGDRHDQHYSGKKMLSRLPNLMKYYRYDLSDLAKRFKNPRIARFMSCFFPENFGALALIFVIASFCGGSADLPVGGSEEMAKRMCERFLSLGGEILCRKDAVTIETKEGKAFAVVFADGERIACDYIVSTIDPARFFGKMINDGMPKRLKKEYKSLARFSACHCALAVDAESLPFKGDVAITVSQNRQKELPARYMLVRNDAHEKGYTPKGKSLIQIMVFCDEERAKEYILLKAKDEAAYKKRKERFAEACVESLLCCYPALEGKISLLDIWTPTTYRRYVNSDIGSFMSFVYEKKCLPIVSFNRVEGCKNLILAGQWLQLPGGLPIAASTGRDAIETISEIEKKEQ